MSQIYIINKIKLSDKGLIISGSQQLAHLRQGELDGACAVYSMMMCLIIEKIIKRSLITDVPTNLKRNTSDGRLVNYFLEKQGMVIDGYILENLKADLQSAFKRKVEPYYNNGEETELVEDIIRFLNDNHPVELGLSYERKKYGHAIVAIGYKKHEHIITLYCLDPGYPIEPCQIWNNVLEIDTNSSAKFNCYNMMDNRSAMIDELLVFKKK